MLVFFIVGRQSKTLSKKQTTGFDQHDPAAGLNAM